jgi:hypothetical protein
MAFAQHAERAVDVADRARDHRLSDAGRAGEDHVTAGGEHRQILLAPPSLDLQAGEQLVDLGLDRAEPDHGFEIVQRVVGGPRDELGLAG